MRGVLRKKYLYPRVDFAVASYRTSLIRRKSQPYRIWSIDINLLPPIKHSSAIENSDRRSVTPIVIFIEYFQAVQIENQVKRQHDFYT